ncbi:SGNH/GDSL hydrolase family protein [Paeniglutamicibacter terrestris]|uniref:SGNH/GDSL hydrolase family protein n=1 Tax=Paeniglutamicibacter terrestris TaxID=2723403 RepID=A0ABX1G4J3_9MICC|nr:SGNH/GDSL hydrolase family protein [Paeniglutamicibacter terrestris]
MDVNHIEAQPRSDSSFRPPGQEPWHRYVALGDSFTEGYGDPEPSSPGGYRGWADRVAEELSLEHDGFSYANLAVRGSTVRQVIDRQLARAVDLGPDLVTFQAGGNDLIRPGADPDRLAAAIEPAIKTLASTGAAVVLFVGPNSGPQTVLGHVRPKIALFNENLRAIAVRQGAVVADLWALTDLTDSCMWDRDRLHLSPMGHQRVAAMVLDSLEVPHGLVPFHIRALPTRTWTRTKADDFTWVREYLVPWVLRKATRHPVLPVPAPKRPTPGPVEGCRSTLTVPRGSEV